MARGLTASTGAVRLTLDALLRVSPVNGLEFTRDAGQRILEGSVVLELKFRDIAPPIFKRLVEQYGLMPRGTSKYRLGMAALNGWPLSESALSPAVERPEPIL
jgi:hypothetical protein